MIWHKILVFSWNFMQWHENHGIGCTPAPGLRNSMYYYTILHDLGSSFRWIPIIFMFFHEIHSFLWNHNKFIKCGFHSFSEEFHDWSQNGMRIAVNSLVYSKAYDLGCEGDHSWLRKSETPSFSWNFMEFDEVRFYGKVWNSRKIHPKATSRARGRKQQQFICLFA